MQVTSKTRWQIRLQNLIFPLLLAAVVGLVAWLTHAHRIEADWTAGGRNTLTETSRRLLEGLDQPVEITAFVREDAQLHRDIERRIDLYRRHKRDIELRFVNPDLNPDLAAREGILRQGQILIRLGGYTERIDTLSEREITRALQRLARGEERWLAFLEGNQERGLSDPGSRGLTQLAQVLERAGFSTRGLDLVRTPAIPDNTRVLVLAGPVRPLLPGAVTLLQDHLAQGGNLLWLVEPGEDIGLEPLARDLGIDFVPGVIVDANTEFRMLLGIEHPAVIPVVDYGQHPVTRNLTTQTLFPVAMALDLDLESAWTPIPLLTTLPRTWAETGNLEGDVSFDDGDRLGPLTLGVALTREIDGREQRVAVIGDSDFLANDYLGFGANLNLATNLFNWLAQDDSLIDITPRSAPDTQIELGDRMAYSLAILFLFVLPGGLLAAGILIWLRRRKR
ncbi:MAG: GldG family protein [Chromatiales bacterium]|nr:GldG family protein [Chromatiales bacterium]